MQQISQYIQAGVGEATRLAGVAQTEITKAAQQNNVNSPLPSDFSSEVEKATKILSVFTVQDLEKPGNTVSNIIPRDIIKKAKGLAVFTIFKAGMFWSGQVGSGVVIARLEDSDEWSPPSCISIGGLGFGMQMGADVSDFVIILNTPEAVKAFSRGENVTLGGNLSVTAGPVGVGKSVSGTILEGAPTALYSYSKSKGLFAGVSVNGTILIERKDANKAFYKKDVTAEQILTGQVEVPEGQNISELIEVIKKAESVEIPEETETETETSATIG
ncbi:14515_t:CDS:2 [Ambispora leptoticha]|uniref:14515_t:CDS:1 n=1 Tax=Ambispora leptoticha TaxID=144679 RepID=A0A9N9GHF7_9GLOM|nr:14515_t:CDS:2 [Ambispora leptoticha]